MTSLEIAGRTIQPGQQTWVSIPIPSALGLDASHIDAFVIHGKKPGPRVFLSAAIHGDELNGIEIIRRIIRRRGLKAINGTLIAVPLVNIYGLANQSRYLPDRRDLNRCFPGSVSGSLAARMAHVFMKEVVSKCTHGIDLHTGAIHRQNIPQIRGFLSDEVNKNMAVAFGTPVMLESDLREGSLREAAGKIGVHTIVYEGGEALRYNEFPIRAGVRGVIQVLQHLGMIKGKAANTNKKPMLAKRTKWLRAPCSGLLRSVVQLGQSVNPGDVLGIISAPGNLSETELLSDCAGIVIGRTTLPIINEGDATLNIAVFANPDRAEIAAERVEAFQNDLSDPVTEVTPTT